MKVALIAQDSLSMLNFARWFADEFRRSSVNLTTISSVEPLFREDIERLATKHHDLAPKRFVAPFQDLIYLVRLWWICFGGRFDLVVTFGTKPNAFAPLAAHWA